MRVAMAQISSGTDPAGNLATIAAQTARAAGQGADIVVFPEAAMCRFGVALGPIAQPLDGPWASAVVELAVRHRLTVVAGMFTPADDGRVHNTVLIAGPDGARTGYHKIHLYDAFGFAESATVAPGDRLVTVGVDGHDVGIATCYDLRFPDQFVGLAERGADLIVVPTSWGAGPGKKEQWRTLATARALDCASYVAAVGQALPDDPAVRAEKAPTGIGFSQLTDPFGSVIATFGETADTNTFDVDLSAVAKARAQLGVLANRTPIS
ncbi:carbon-nitrogen hydrolase family protein [Gordonia sp. TBRC 11910]|uniref:Carbon-nitrogen hydrolase family protein n=1 Tax=Gordonia asplenii TaxID=2725283 RepID=A0A848KV86_9ACTN|nr:carbon-nitrogen hydrolase family protein [Gordonia asplenii]NMO00775.1 carbon-nitrogen hydrolase family protein [Gordonia asplenii]